jgi:deazaflavin-dependent oxidoreductase (nitroreductase family)
MSKFHKLPKSVFRLIKHPPQIAYALGLGPLIGRLVLLLTTTGRVSGLPRVTPLQYEKVGADIYVGAARGMKSDWVMNILAHPEVAVRVKNRRFKGKAEVIHEPDKKIEFLEIRLKNHPRMMAAMLKADGISGRPTREELAHYARQIALVVIHPDRVDMEGQRKASG